MSDPTEDQPVRVRLSLVAPFIVAAILWGGSTEYRVQADSSSIEKIESRVTKSDEAVARIDERLKAIKESLDRIERSIDRR